MGQDASRIREELEETRQRVGDEIDALSYKTDVKARAGDYVDEKKESVKSKLSSAKEAVMGVGSDTREVAGSAASSVGSAADAVGSRIPDRQAVASRARGLRWTAEHNPLGLAIGGLAVGFVIGTLLPETKVENDRLGEMSDRLMDTARETAHDAVDRGKQVAQDVLEQGREAAQDAVDTTVGAAKQSAREQGQELGSTLQDRAQSVTQA
jgi:hypothetical protein